MTDIIRVDPSFKKLLGEIKSDFAIKGIKISDREASKILAKRLKLKDLDLFNDKKGFFDL